MPPGVGDRSQVPPQPPRVLVVEDDTPIRVAVEVSLRGEGYEVLALGDGRHLRSCTEDFRPDLALLDVRLDDGPDGYALARELRGRSGMPILFLTAADAVEDRLAGFDAGGDDYVVKPFSMAELLARVRSLLRRSGRLASASWQVGDLVVDDSDRSVVRAGVRLELTPTEYDLLVVLVRHVGTVLTKTQLLSHVWGFDAYDTNLVEVHTSALRRKLEQTGPRIVHTVRGAGYVLRA